MRLGCARLAVLGSVLASLVPPATSAAAGAANVTAVGGRFLPAEISILHGQELTLTNADLVPHNVISFPARNGARFSSATIPTGRTATVEGVRTAPPGSYGFYCSLHPTMTGRLDVKRDRSTVVVPVPTQGSVATPTSITFHKDALYVASLATGTVERLPVLPGGLLGPGTTYASGFDTPLGTVFGPDGTLYVSDSHLPRGATRRSGRVRAVPPGGGGPSRMRVVVDHLPQGRHATNGLAVAGGRLYIANGNATDDGRSGGPPELPLSGTILSVPLSARDIDAVRQRARVVVEAKGLRNPYDLAFRPGTAELWTPTNGPDRQDPFGEDLLHRFRVDEPTVDFGFPACIYAATPRGPKATQNPAVSTRCRAHRPPEITLGLHVSANGLAFGPKTGGWKGDLFIAEFGSTDAPPRGHAVVRVPMLAGRAGAPESVYASAAPLDVAFGPAGLYVADLSQGTITLLVSID